MKILRTHILMISIPAVEWGFTKVVTEEKGALAKGDLV